MKINCQEHRKMMQLASLKVRLGKKQLSSKEKESIKKSIKEIEKEMEMN
ncbi:DUF465 domain-containing protein [Candidatus Magnetomoraceae bacterium gMMP-15]